MQCAKNMSAGATCAIIPAPKTADGGFMDSDSKQPNDLNAHQATHQAGDENNTSPVRPAPKEIGGPKGPEPTRYGDWERNGRCSDF